MTDEQAKETLEKIVKKCKEELGNNVSFHKFGDTLDYYLIWYGMVGKVQVYCRRVVSLMELEYAYTPEAMANIFIRDTQASIRKFKQENSIP